MSNVSNYNSKKRDNAKEIYIMSISYKKLQQTLTAERNKLYALFNSMPFYVYLLAPDYSITFANRKFRTSFGDPEGKKCYQVMKDRDQPCEICLAMDIFETQEPNQWEIAKPDGRIYEIYGYPFTDSDGSQLVLEMGLDITERRQYQRYISRMDQLNSVGQMAATISHEVRNPMTTVRGFLQMLRGKGDCAKYREYFDLMISELDRSNAIIGEYLAMAKDKQVKMEKQNLNHIIESISPLMMASAINEGKNIVLNLGNMPELMLDGSEIRQLVLNLVKNGLEAMDAGGEVIIRTSTLSNECVLLVKDQGKGIDAQIFNQLGTPFLTNKDNGTGLGLATCYSIAQRHNAEIEVTTSPTGTVFMVRFQKNDN